MNPFNSHVLQATLRDGEVWLSYRLGMADGITLFSCCGRETDYSILADDEPAPVVDSRPKRDPDQAETRRYLAVLRYSANENRQLSNEIVITLP